MASTVCAPSEPPPPPPSPPSTAPTDNKKPAIAIDVSGPPTIGEMVTSTLKWDPFDTSSSPHPGPSSPSPPPSYNDSVPGASSASVVSPVPVAPAAPAASVASVAPVVPAVIPEAPTAPPPPPPSQREGPLAPQPQQTEQQVEQSKPREEETVDQSVNSNKPQQDQILGDQSQPQPQPQPQTYWQSQQPTQQDNAEPVWSAVITGSESTHPGAPRTISLSIPEEDLPMTSSTPPPEVVETEASPVLKKTRGRDRDREDSRDGNDEEQSPGHGSTKQSSLSAPLKLRKSPGHSRSPSDNRGRSSSARPLSQFLPTSSHLSAGPAGPTSRSHSAHSSESSITNSPGRGGVNLGQRRRSWLPTVGGRSRSNSYEPPVVPQTSTAWVLAPESRADYNVNYLVNGEKVPELWDDNGTLYVYLSPRDSGKGASFKVRGSIIEQSRVLCELVRAEMASPVSARSRARSFGGRDSLTADDAHRINSPPTSPPLPGMNESRLHLPVEGGSSELERLVAIRNLFALLTGQPLIGTQTHPTVFAALIQVATLLREFDFGFQDGSVSFGEAVDVSIGFFVEQNGLVDVRHSREKTIEALVLSEQLRFWPLYNEAFCHAVGKYPALRDLKSPLWDRVSQNTRQRLERANLDLVNRQHSVNTRLEQFEFPSLFAGVANSTSNDTYRNLRFKNWRSAFHDMRSFALKYYRSRFGSWPPKASSRRNPFSESGLNREVLKTLYADLCSVYDLLADRTSVTPRVGEDGVAAVSSSSSDPSHPALSDPAMMALRQVMGEFDMSSPPVLPPMPFDIPKIPMLGSLRDDFANMPHKDQIRFGKNLQSYEIQLLLFKSHNPDAEQREASPFLAAFEDFEMKEAKHGRTDQELSEMRIGHWLFLYVVLQSMPMLVVDAPGLQFTDGVEYFLCEPPQGRPPWVEDAGEVRKAWFQTAGGAGPLVELSADVLLYSVEATYHRSHCWLAAKKWEAEAAMGMPTGGLGVGVPTGVPMGVPMGVPATDLPMLDGSGDLYAVPPQLQPEDEISSIPPTPDNEEPRAPRAATLPELPAAALALANANTSVPNLARPGSTDATTSRGSSPLQRASPPIENDDNNNNETSISPSMSPDLSAHQRQQSLPQLAPLALPTPQLLQPAQRDSYLQQQQRANLRHASIGWQLEPVQLAEDSHLNPPANPYRPSTSGGLSSARRIASAGNLRTMVAANEGGNRSVSTSFQPAEADNTARGIPTSQSSASLAPPPMVNTGSTFDAILSTMDNQKKAKKRNSFLPFM